MFSFPFALVSLKHFVGVLVVESMVSFFKKILHHSANIVLHCIFSFKDNTIYIYNFNEEELSG